MLKNSTPRQIAVFVAVFTTVFSVVAIGLIYLLTHFSLYLAWWFLLPTIIFAISYFVTIHYLKQYIYRKIKLIYKTIHQHKLSPGAKATSIDIDSYIIDEVEEEVNLWAEEQRAELARYKTWADYRRKFVGDISHELKTPIFNIQGYLHTLLDGGLEDADINMPFLQKAAKNVDRLHTIVEDLSAISRLESGEMILEKQTFDIKLLAEEVLEDLEFKANERGISLGFKEGANQNFRVRADRESIRQVLINLVDNSIKYGRSGGHTKISLYDMDKNILIEVADNGIGIPAQHLPHVFDRFYRVDKSRSRAQGGSGLGLAIVKHIVEAHTQTINVRSSDQLGSTFGFTLGKA